MHMKVQVTVPATTANLGPGFDCLGLALGLTNTVTFTAVDATTATTSITITGEGANHLPRDGSNLVLRAAEVVFDGVGERPSTLHIHQHNNIPVGSGLGSSAAAVLGGMLAANGLLGSPLSQEDVLHLAIDMEGHPDNVAPALYGGLVLSVRSHDNWHIEAIAIPPLQVVYVLPDFDFPTAAARAALPAHVPLADAVFNAGRVGLLVRALTAGDFAALATAMQDRLHQPYRIPLVPGLAQALQAAQAAGAASAAISGAGPSVVAFAATGHEKIVTAVTAVFAEAGLHSRAWILPVAQHGAEVCFV